MWETSACRAHQFPLATSLSAALSSVRSATIFRNRWFSRRSSFSFFASSTPLGVEKSRYRSQEGWLGGEQKADPPAVDLRRPTIVGLTVTVYAGVVVCCVLCLSRS
jgi:hypothetical protein